MADKEISYSIHVINAFKSYVKNKYTLKGLDMKVKSGTM